MQNYLRNKAGYYHAVVNYDTLVSGRRLKVKYVVEPNDRYTIGDIKYYGLDTNIIQEIRELQDKALLKSGEPIDASVFDLELSRLTLALQNKGYANFAANYFSIKGDSSTAKKTVDIYLEVKSPLPDTLHTKYTIGNINVYTDYHRSQTDSMVTGSQFDNKYFYGQSVDYIVKPSTINNMIFLEKGEVFSRENRSKTFRKLSELGTYKFVTISPSVSAESDTVLNYDIYLTPQKYRWVADFGSELFYSTVNQNSNQLFGVSLSSLFQNRNFLGGSEQFSIGTETGLEMQLPLQVRTVNLSLNTNLEIPKQVDLFNLTKLLTSISVLPKGEYQRFKEETKTNIGAGVNFINVFDNYSISSVSANYSYDYKRNSNERYRITTVGVDLNIYNLKDPFIAQNSGNALLLNTFEDNLITGFLFKDITYVRSTPTNDRGLSKALIVGFETSGLEKALLNGLYNTVSGSNSDWRAGSIAFAKYLRLEIDQRWYQQVTEKTSFAFRTYGGIIMPFGADVSSPFVRQFSVGGPNSIRAWDQRELGPGGFSELLEDPNIGQTFFQQGDIKLEFNVEYRFPLYWLLEGALFVDAGNVWTISEDVDRLGAQFTDQFYKQIAVGIGYGIRFDFEYFNIRFDFGYKLRNPYPEGEVTVQSNVNGYWYTLDGIRNQGFGNFQVAVNYPF